MAEQHAGAVDVAAAFLGDIDEGRCLRALVIAAGDEVDDAADGVGAVDGRCTIAEDFDAFDRGERDGVQVHRATLQAVGGDAAAVQQHERRIGALAAQVGAGHAVVAALVLVDDARVARQVVRAIAGDVEIAEQLLGGGDALLVDLLLGEGGDRQRILGLGALDARAGHRDLVQGLLRLLIAGSRSVLRHRGRGHGGHQRDAEIAELGCRTSVHQMSPLEKSMDHVESRT